MALVTGPLLSFGAAGQIAKTQVYSKWKGRAYVRRFVMPANPQSTEQVKTRSVFSWINNVWRTAPTNFVTPWNAYVKGKVMIGRNAFLQKGITELREAATLDGMTLSPGAAGGLTVAPSVTPGSGTLTIDLVAPSPLPSGWTIVKAVAVAILDQDPHTDVAYTVESGSDATSTYQVVLSGLEPGDWAVGAWFEYQRSALATDLAYGASVAEIATVT